MIEKKDSEKTEGGQREIRTQGMKTVEDLQRRPSQSAEMFGHEPHRRA